MKLIETRDPATGRPATLEASARAEAVYQIVFDTLCQMEMAEASRREIAEEAYKVALFRYDNPWR